MKKRVWRIVSCLVLAVLVSITFNMSRAEAAEYEYTINPMLGTYQLRQWDIVIFGRNITQGFVCNLPYTIEGYPFRIKYVLPDDGSTWQVIGSVVDINQSNAESKLFTTWVNTPGSYSGYSPRTATDSANNAANIAQDGRNWAVNAYYAGIDARDWAYNATVAGNNAASIAEGARVWAYNATDAANRAQDRAIEARDWAINAYYAGNDGRNWAVEAANRASNATNAANNAADWARDAAYNAGDAARAALDAENSASNAFLIAYDAYDAAYDAANNTTYNGESAAYWAYQASTIVPEIQSVKGVNDATCTTTSTYSANVTISPGDDVTYTLDSIAGPGTANFSSNGNTLTVSSIRSSGAYTVNFTATYAPSGKTSKGSFTFFKI